MQKNSNSRLIIGIAGLALTLVLSGAIAVSYFLFGIGEAKNEELTVQIGHGAQMVFSDNDTGLTGKLSVGDTATKYFKIENEGQGSLDAYLLWKDIVNTYLPQSLTYTLEASPVYRLNENPTDITYTRIEQVGTNVPTSKRETTMPLSKTINVPASSKVFYKITIKLEDLADIDQSQDLEALLSTAFTIEQGSFTGYTPFTVTSENRTVVGYTGTENEELIIPRVFRDTHGIWFEVNAIGDNAFSELTNLSSVEIPDSVTSIGNSAFLSNAISNITIGNSVKTIGTEAFNDCYNLISVIIPDSVTSIGTDAFANGINIQNLVIGNSVTSIANIGLADLVNLKTLTIGGGIKTISSGMFDGNGSLLSVTINDGVKAIGADAFDGCTKLQSVIIPDSVTSIGQEAFSTCLALSNLTMGKGVTTIGKNAFSDCIPDTVILPSSLTTVTNDIFLGAEIKNLIIEKCLPTMAKGLGAGSITSITVKSGTIGDNFLYQSSDYLISLTIGKDVDKIGNSAFYSSVLLTDLTIENGVKSIGNHAFAGCEKLTTLIIPDSVVSIGTMAFDGCTSLTTMTVGSGVTTIDTDAFYSTALNSISYSGTVYTDLLTFRQAFNNKPGHSMGTQE